MFGLKAKNKKATKNQSASAAVFANLRENIIGHDAVIDGPFGPRRLFYADYVASGRSYGPIEDTIRNHVLPMYANTHTESSATGRQSTAYREQARDIIARNVGATEDDAVLFCGAGCTGAIDKLIGMLGLKLPRGLSRFGIKPEIDPDMRPVVFIGPYEHHSNDVQWRETIADVVTIAETKDGLLDLGDLEVQLKKYENRPLKVGSFSAGSNVTGILTDVQPIAKLLHKYDAKACFDFAASAPYERVDMNPKGGEPLDAIFVSVHKFLGGPGTPGLLVMKKKLARNKTPVIPGGGTVTYVSPCAQAYYDDVEHREEGGTPNVIGDIRAALAFLVKDAIGQAVMDARHAAFDARARAVWSSLICARDLTSLSRRLSRVGS